MPKCKNDPILSFKGTEPSPKGLGWCAHSIKVGAVKKGKDGNKWIVKEIKNGSKRWMKVKDESKNGKNIFIGLEDTVFLINIYKNTVSIYISSYELGTFKHYNYNEIINFFGDKKNKIKNISKKILKWTPTIKINKPYYLSKLDKEVIKYFDTKIKEFKNVKNIMISKQLKTNSVEGYIRNILLYTNNKYICLLPQTGYLEINTFQTKNNDKIINYYGYNWGHVSYHYAIGEKYVYLLWQKMYVPITDFKFKIKNGTILINNKYIDLNKASENLQEPYITKPRNITKYKANKLKYYPNIPKLKIYYITNK